jgi:nicotinate-nucleotide adenylyltransferase
MQFFRCAAGQPLKLGVFPGTFNPPTRAHVALARAALARVDEALFVLPQRFPHKTYEGAGFEDRVRMLQAALADEPRFSIGASQGGLFIDIVRECREAYGPAAELFFLCGRDAAERVVTWDYGRPGAFQEQLREYQLLIAPRQGGYETPPELHGAGIHILTVEDRYADLSASDVRSRLRNGEPWEHLVPPQIEAMVREIYG